MGMADNYYTPKDDDGLECYYCEGTGEADGGDCPQCDGVGYVDSSEICGLCNAYPCRCDDIYDSWKERDMEW
jgi:hypothetical protein